MAAPILTASPNPSTMGDYTVSWTVTGWASYRFLERVGGRATWAVVYSHTGSSKDITGKSSRSSRYRLEGCCVHSQARSHNCERVGGGELTVVVIGPPIPGMGARPDTSSTGSYTLGCGTSTGATSYTLDEKVNGGAWSSVYIGADTSTTRSHRSNGIYTYRAMACDGTACSSWTSEKTVTVSLVISAGLVNITPCTRGTSAAKSKRKWYKIAGSWKMVWRNAPRASVTLFHLI